MLTLLAQIPDGDDRRPIAQALRLCAETARSEGVEVVTLPAVLEGYAAAELLARLRPGPAGPLLFSGALWPETLGRELEAHVRELGYRPLNSVDETLRAMRFERFYPLLEDLTARSAVAGSKEEALSAVEALGLPLFAKEPIKSAKELGWAACTIGERAQIERLPADRFPLVLRQIMPLRRRGEERNGFPVSREYRFYLYRGRLLGGGYYWGGEDPFEALSPTEQAACEALACQAAERVGTPLLACDLGQLDDRSWRVVEVGDPQFSGIAHMSRPLFWRSLQGALSEEK